MSRFIETIRVCNGTLERLEYHQQRFERTREKALGERRHPDLVREIPLPRGLEEGLYRCRVLYGKKIERIEFEPHIPRRTRNLKLVRDNRIDYRHKYSNRSELTALFQRRGECDDILIVRNGQVTDSYYANVVLWGEGDWVTPDIPLLKGTMRAYLLDKGIIRAVPVPVESLANYSRVRLVNALHPLDEAPEIPVNAIKA